MSDLAAYAVAMVIFGSSVLSFVTCYHEMMLALARGC
jgi:hypothetical protein